MPRKRTPPPPPPGTLKTFAYHGYLIKPRTDGLYGIWRDGGYIGSAKDELDAKYIIDEHLPKANPPRQSKTVDVFLPIPRASAVKWLKARRIPFTHMRDHFNGVAFRIRRGYLLDFQHEKDKAAPRYTNRTRVRRVITRRTVSRRTRRNPYRHTGKTYETTLNTVRVKFFQGYVEDVRYTRAEDGKPYSHVVETDAAELYLCEHATYGRCLLIVDPSGKTPLWG